MALADQKNLTAPMLSHLMAANTAIIDRTFAAVAKHERVQVALFGLAFKQGSAGVAVRDARRETAGQGV